MGADLGGTALNHPNEVTKPVRVPNVTFTTFTSSNKTHTRDTLACEMAQLKTRGKFGAFQCFS